MHAMSLLDKWLQRNAVIAHRARGHALVPVVGALLSGGKLALTNLGRHRAGRAFVKHHIKAVDRLLCQGQSPRASGTRWCPCRVGEDGAGRRRTSGDSCRLGRQRARTQAAHHQGRGAGEGTSDFDLRKSASDAPLQQPREATRRVRYGNVSASPSAFPAGGGGLT